MPLVIVTSIFVGAVTAVQAVYQMQSLVPMKFLGVMISKTVFIELGPVLMALVVGSRLCAFYAAELGHDEGDRAAGRHEHHGHRSGPVPGHAPFLGVGTDDSRW